MIIIKVQGGLGNQLQQYAMYVKFQKLGKDVRLDTSWFQKDIQKKQYMQRKLELDYFKHPPYQICTKEEKEALLGKENSIISKFIQRTKAGKEKYFREEGRMYLPEVFLKENAYVDGYWACEAYYHDVLEELREQLVFPESPILKNQEVLKKMQQENAVSIHIRRGDYLNKENAALFGNICTKGYYDEAIRRIKEKVLNPYFYIFSDDATYAREQFSGENTTIVDWNTKEWNFYDMLLMSQCKHNICANSTFSFWGARLNSYKDKMIIRPLKHRNNQVYDLSEMKELWKGYTLIDV